MVSGQINDVALNDSGQLSVKRAGKARVLVSINYPLIASNLHSSEAISMLMVDTATTTSSTELSIPSDTKKLSDEHPSLVTGWFSDAQGRRISRINLHKLYSDSQSLSSRKNLRVPPAATLFSISINVRNNRFALNMELPSVSVIKSTTIFTVYRWLLLVIWALLGLIVLRELHRKLPTRSMIMGVVAGTVLTTGITLSQGLVDLYVLPVYRAVLQFTLQLNPENGFYLFKTGHLIVFFIVGLLTFSASRDLKWPRYQLLGILIGIATATEGVQLSFIHRSPRWQDIIVNVLGLLLAYGVVTAYSALKNRKATHHTPS